MVERGSQLTIVRDQPEFDSGYWTSIVDVALAYARRDFKPRIDLDAPGMDGQALELGAAINMLGEELSASVVSINDLEEVNQKLLAKNRELDEFTYMASHDLQEPLRKIVTFSDILKMDLGDALDEDSRENLDFLVGAAQRMQTLVQDLLRLSRSGRVALERQELSMSECVLDALTALEMSIKEHGAKIQIDDLPTIWADKTMITQLLQNLIGNALKFIEAKQPIIRITCEEKNGETVFGVKDNGIGIKEEYRKQVFAPFKRLHGRHEFEGSGMGLSICRKIVERHGGNIWIDSEPGQGSHFQFTINTRENN